MLGRTLTFYFARHFAKLVLSIFLLTMRSSRSRATSSSPSRALGNDAADWKTLALVAIFRVPNVAEETAPFTVLYGSIAAFIITNRRLEIVVARAAGVSAWQFLLPACAVGLLFGAFITTVFNPIAASLMATSQSLNSVALGNATQEIVSEDKSGPVWLRQRSGAFESIIGSQSSFDGGLGLVDATAYVFGPDGAFHSRIDAPRAHFYPGEWRLEDAIETSLSRPPRLVPLYSLPTNLSPDEVKQTFLKLDSVSFWSLPGLAAAARRAGLSTARYVCAVQRPARAPDSPYGDGTYRRQRVPPIHPITQPCRRYYYWRGHRLHALHCAEDR